MIGQDSLAQGVCYHDPTGIDKELTMFIIEGEFQDGEEIYGQETGIHGSFVESASTYTDFDIWSGEILYKENLIFITRRDIQVEKFVFTIEF